MTVHIPILLNEIVDALKVPFERQEGAYVDCTFGGGGHSGAMLSVLPAHSKVIGIDRDEGALQRGKQRYPDAMKSSRLELLHGDFATVVEEWKGPPIVALLADLGFSSDQIESSDRGLSFLRDGPLDMRLDPSQGQTARFFLQTASEKEIADLIHEYGQDRFARKIARVIVDRRREGGIPDSTVALAEWIRAAYPGPARHSGRIHPATRTFQALRIHINDELCQLRRLLAALPGKVGIGGRVAFLTFHSLEDRIVKHTFKEDPQWKALSKKPIEASESEVQANPRSRSAKLRIYERVDQSLTR
jgi:16S rRNA (cytosine1402-N4)-methyltransferase